MGVIAVLAAALGGFAFGAAWYMALSEPWVKASGVTCGEDGKPVNASNPVPYVISALAMILVAGMMRHVFSMAGIDGAFKGAVAGLGVGLFFITPWMAMNHAYSMRPANLTLIDGGYAVFGSGVIGLILGMF